MLRNLEQLVSGYEPWQIAIEFAVIWICVFAVFRFLRGTRGAGVVKGVVLLILLITLTVRVLGQGSDTFSRLNFIYDRFISLLAILMIVVFQPELRQAMSRLGHVWTFRPTRGDQGTVIKAVADAVTFLSKSQFGALIAIERGAQLGSLSGTGVELDAVVSERLLSSIFWPNSPLHDLGVVIRGDRVTAASVQFPLAEDGVLPGEFGSRHRAAVGLSQESDCLVVIVSEETGRISIAEHGRLDDDLPRDRIEEILARRLQATVAPPAGIGDDAESSDDDGRQAA